MEKLTGHDDDEDSHCMDPKHQLDEDLVRMKTLIEEGITPHDAARRIVRYRTKTLARSQAALITNKIVRV